MAHAVATPPTSRTPELPIHVTSREQLVVAYAEGHRVFDGSVLDDADLSGLNLTNASFRDAKLRRTKVGDADLGGLDLSHAELRVVEFDAASFKGVRAWPTDRLLYMGATLDDQPLLPAVETQRKMQQAQTAGRTQTVQARNARQVTGI